MVVRTNPAICPNCRRGQFIILESITTMYLTDYNGEIIDAKERGTLCYGFCTHCKSKFKMYGIHNKYYPIPKTVDLIGDYSLIEKADYEEWYCENPMGVNK